VKYPVTGIFFKPDRPAPARENSAPFIGSIRRSEKSRGRPGYTGGQDKAPAPLCAGAGAFQFFAVQIRKKKKKRRKRRTGTRAYTRRPIWEALYLFPSRAGKQKALNRYLYPSAPLLSMVLVYNAFVKMSMAVSYF